MSRATAGPPGSGEASTCLAWAREYLPEYFSDEPSAFHRELLRDLESPERRLIARVAPRGHAKSTCAALAYPLWCICAQKRRNIVIITHESSLARQFVRDIRHELETNELILTAYGDLCTQEATQPRSREATKEPGPKRPRGIRAPTRTRTKASVGVPPAKGSVGVPPAASALRRPKRTKWSEEKFTTTTGITVQAKSTGGSFRGTRVGPQRPDLIICDDIEKDEHVESPEGRRKLEHWLRRVVMPALAPDGQLVVVGSIIHYDSLLANLRDRLCFPCWDYQVYRALEAELGPDGQYRLRALWPGRWPLEKLQEERQRVGTLAFEQEYMANPIDDSIRVFRPEWLRRYDPAELDARRDQLVTLMAVDPAAGVSDGDYFALWIGSLDLGTSRIYTRQLTLERVGIVEQVKRIVAAFEQWRPAKIGIETVAYQVALKDILEDYSRKNRLFMPIVALRTVANKRARIEGASPFFENGTFRLPPVLDPEIESQFLHFPKARHDDAPDVCAMGIELARSFRAGGPIEGATTGRRNPFARRGAW
jgi:predicted phage terminase large subunit-like protein